MRSSAAMLLSAVLLVAAATGCAEVRQDDDNKAAGPALTTPSEVRNAVFERSYSECATYGLRRLAAKYNVSRERDAVAGAVARWWTKNFKAGDDAVLEGRNGCLQGFEQPSGPTN